MKGFEYTYLIPLIPLFSFLIIGLFYDKWSKKFVGIFGTLSIFTSFVISLYTAYKYFFVVGKVNGFYQQIIGMDLKWLRFSDTLVAHMGTLIDPISMLLIVVVTTVSLMVHIYSTGYMNDDRGFNRFFAFLSLFSFSMLGLVLATNLFQIYIFWELVGVSSFLLIGFYYEKPSAVAASKKAFIVTRFADLFFLIGILVLSFNTKTFDFLSITSIENVKLLQHTAGTFMGLSVMTWALVLIFIGGAGKSAMFPLHIWLPDAMEGPSPVSALIHAATMVVAGVYLVARLFPAYAFGSPQALHLVGYIGAFTSLFAAIIAVTQLDFKRVLAFSTISQIGYMMVGLGVSGYGGHEGLGYMASMFHLFTHAMFKALLFLGAGAVIHSVHTNNIDEMGGLRKHMKITHWTFLIATLTIAGVPGFAGFFSKDEIIAAAFEHNKLIYYSSVLVAGLTAFYMFRLYFRVFWNKEPNYEHKPHEVGPLMYIPLIFLAIMSVTVGYIPFNQLISPDLKPFASHIEWGDAIWTILVSFTGIALAWFLYKSPKDVPAKIAKALNPVYKFVFEKFHIDEIWLFVTKKIVFNLVARPIAWFDRNIVDGTMNGIAWVTGKSADKIKGMQSGQLQKNLYWFVSGTVIIAIVVLYFLTK